MALVILKYSSLILMPTSLETSPVTRLLKTEIDGKPVSVTLEVRDGLPVLRLRVKGQRTGWFMNLNNLCEIASWHPRLKDKDMELKMTPKQELKQGLEKTDWKSLYGNELL